MRSLHHLGGLLLALLGVGLTACADDGAENVGVAEAACHATVSKTVVTSIARSWAWDIEKTVTPSALTLPVRETGKVNYEVMMTPTMTNEFKVDGEITLSNGFDVDVEVTSITDTIMEGDTPTAIPVEVLCPSNVVEAMGTLTCTYSAILPDATTRMNRVEVVSGGITESAEEEIAFADEPTTETDECVAVSDSMAGPLGEICAKDEVLSIFYESAIGPYEICGEQQAIANNASFVTNDTETKGEATATLTVDVLCRGCTLTLGYWKNHADSSQMRFDDTWLEIGAAGAASVFCGDKTYLEVLQTPPRGDAFYILAHQYIAAKLNGLAGADQDGMTAEAFDAAAVCLAPPYACSRAEMLEYASTLDAYNNGLTGPGHCSE
jgi:hypothetical protein